MARAIILLLFFSHLSFADNTTQITFKGAGSSITTKQVGSGNATYILCGSPTANNSGSFPGTTYVSHTCSRANVCSYYTSETYLYVSHTCLVFVGILNGIRYNYTHAKLPDTSLYYLFIKMLCNVF